MSDPFLQELEAQVEKLIERCEQLDSANQQLRDRESTWRSERSQLTQAQDATQVRVEAMINRLKSLEQS
jgi:cell division protein ZapB